MRSENSGKRTRKLSTKFIAGFVLLGVLICGTSCTIGYVKYKTVIEKLYNDLAYQIAYEARSFVDGDELARCAADGAPSPAYRDMDEQISRLRTNMAANYIYITTIDPDGTLTYLYDCDNPDDSLPPFAIGDTGTMKPEYLSDILRVQEEGVRVDNYFYSKSQFGYNTTAPVPVYRSDGSILAVLGVEIAMSRLQSTLWEYVLYAVVISSILVCLCILVYLMYLHRKVIHPIRLITSETARFVESETQPSELLPTVETGDEIETLARSISKMETDLRVYIDNLTAVTAEKERIGAELGVATHIQASMLPCIFPAFPDRPEFDIYATMQPAKEVGGDFYDFFLVDDDHLAMVIADVSGKGVPAALFMVIAKTLLKNCAQTGASPKEVLEKVNDQLCENNEAEMFVTVWLGILEISTGTLTCANAGHEYPALRRAGGAFELVQDKHGFVLAGMEGARYRQYELTLAPGDMLYVYTDGVAEATDAHDVLFGTERMLAALNRHPDAAPQQLLPLMKEDIDAFVGEAPQFDDITMLSLTYRGPERRQTP